MIVKPTPKFPHTHAPVPRVLRPSFWSLTAKVGLLAVLIGVVVLAFFAAIFILSERQKATTNTLERGVAFAQLTNRQVVDDYRQWYMPGGAAQFETFTAQIKELLSYNPAIANISIAKLDGTVLFDSQELTDGRYHGATRTLPVTVLAKAHSDGLQTRDVTVQGEHYSEIVVPTRGTVGGQPVVVRYLVSYRAVSAHMATVYWRLAIVEGLLMILIVSVAMLLSRRVAKPITLLTGIAEKVRMGDFTSRVEVKGSDELARLSASLNEMTAQLAGYYSHLETVVKDRTHELEATVNRDNALLSSIGDGVIATDNKGVIVMINKAGESMLQVGYQEAVTKHYDVIWNLEKEDGSQIPTMQHPIYMALHDGASTKTSNYYYTRKDPAGNKIVHFPVAVTTSPVTLGGKIIGVINVFRDVTHEKQVDRMKNEFISLASHQLRTPLSAIKWFVEMLLNGDAGKLTEDQQEFAANISSSTQRMIELVGALLNISRIESGRIIIDPTPTDLSELVGGIINDLKGRTEKKHQTLTVNVQQGLPKINLDPHLIGQVYLNLLTNAIKYTPDNGEIVVMISVKGDQVISQVTDTGYGIPVAEQAKLFGKFFRASNIVRVETDGTGLGLYLVKAIVQSSGGKIWFESAEGKGTTFWFSLPLAGMKAQAGEVSLDTD